MSPPDGRVGFGGAAVVRLDELPQTPPPGSVCFFGVDVELSRAVGLPNPGAASFIRRASARMAPWLKYQDRPRTGGTARYAWDVGVLRGTPTVTGENVALTGCSLARAGYIPVAVGCDHSVSYWHACGVAAASPDVAYVYLDAHLDLGLHHERGRGAMHNGNFVRHLVDTGRLIDIVNIGARAWSIYDRAYDNCPVRRIQCGTLKAMTHHLAFLKGRVVYISIDADILDPAVLPNACCPEPLGMSAESLLSLLGWISRSCRVIGADFSEMTARPKLRYTAELALRLLFEAVWPEQRLR